MKTVFTSTLLLTILLAIGLIFFLRAASKDRTTVVEVYSPRPPLEVLNGISQWLEERGWRPDGGDVERQLLCFTGNVASSQMLAILLSVFGIAGSGCLGLVLIQLYPSLGWWPLLLACLGPIAGLVYQKRANRSESLEVRLMDKGEGKGSTLRIRAHRDELIAMEVQLAKSLELASDGALLSSPI